MTQIKPMGLALVAGGLAVLASSCGGPAMMTPEPAGSGGPRTSAAASFADFDRRARAGERLTVGFFGASLTWGANATDPQQTSYRALVGQRLQRIYPKAHFKFIDAAIGGTGSQLGLFRLDRDVLRHKPDLVFVDFSANDDIYSADEETLASYEAIVRRIVLEARSPVVIVLFPFQWNVAMGNLDAMKRRDAHLAIGKAYRAPVGDAIGLAVERVRSGAATIEKLWPVDGVHPCDAGYVLFADAAWQAFEEAVKRQVVCRAPDTMLHGPTYLTSARVRISTLGVLPAGWRVRKPNVVSAFFDMLMSRWLDHESVASNRQEVAEADGKKKLQPCEVARLKVRFNGSMVMLFGESTPRSCKYRAYVDGQLVEHKSPDGKEILKEFDAGFLANLVKGNAHHAQVIATGLDAAADHALEIEPIMAGDAEQELRLESICVAGGKAKVWMAD
jgi:lysophospholipase L1-like esterase